MNECEQFTGRLRAICEGTADLPLYRINAYRQKWGLSALAAKPEGVLESQSSSPDMRSRGLGDRVARGIQRMTLGKVKPCGGCKKRAARLNEWFPAKHTPLVPRAFGGPPRRNLIYHVYPVRANDLWRWNVEQLLRRIDLFDGRRVVAIVTDRSTHAADTVQRAFGNTVSDWIVRTNDKRLGEALTFGDLLLAVMDSDPQAITFYGHAKGVTRKPSERPVIQHWTQRMYECCLDDPEAVAELLVGHGVAGAYRRHQRLGKASWYYSGSFFWVRHAHAVARNWEFAEKRYWAAESWPGRMFSLDESGVLCADHVRSLYTEREWDRLNAEAADRAGRRGSARASVPATPAAPASEAPELTLVTPTGDRPVAFGLCERWMRAQTYDRHYQWIVVDDGSVGTRVMCGQDYLRRAPARGPGHTLTAQLRAAIPRIRGRKVLIIEDDEWYGPDYLARMVAALEDRPLVGAGFARYYWPRVARFREFPEHAHASLCRTGLRRELLDALAESCRTADPSVDLRLWSLIAGHRLECARPLAVGMKGMPGRRSGGGDPAHGQADGDLAVLRQWIGDDVAHYRPILPKASDVSRAQREQIVVYTVVLGGYDTVHRPAIVNPHVRYVAITDGPAPPPWEVVRPREKSADRVRDSRRWKLLAHELFPDADWTIYLDGQLQLAVDPVSLLAECEAWGPGDLYLFHHQDRECLYAEAREVLRIGKDRDRRTVDAQIARYRAAGFPEAAGLYLGGMLVRSPAAAKFNLRWWDEVQRGSHRDQISVPVALAASGVRHTALPALWWQHFFLRHKHAVRSVRRLPGRRRCR